MRSTHTQTPCTSQERIKAFISTARGQGQPQLLQRVRQIHASYSGTIIHSIGRHEEYCLAYCYNAVDGGRAKDCPKLSGSGDLDNMLAATIDARMRIQGAKTKLSSSGGSQPFDCGERY